MDNYSRCSLRSGTGSYGGCRKQRERNSQKAFGKKKFHNGKCAGKITYEEGKEQLKKIEKDKLYSDDINALSEYRNTDLDKIERMDIIKLERKSNIYDRMTFYGKIKWTVSGMEGVYDETCEYHIGVDVDSGEYKLISFEIQDK